MDLDCLHKWCKHASVLGTNQWNFHSLDHGMDVNGNVLFCISCKKSRKFSTSTYFSLKPSFSAQDWQEHICTKTEKELHDMKSTCCFQSEGEQYVACAINIKKMIHGHGFSIIDKGKEGDNSNNQDKEPIEITQKRECLGKGSYGCVDSITLQSHNSGKLKKFACKRMTITTKFKNDLDDSYPLKERECLMKSTELNTNFTIKYYGAMKHEGEIYIILERMDANLTKFNKALVKLGYTGWF